MSSYTIFRRPGDEPEKSVFVKDGLSAPALLFTVLWALWHRMWVVAAIMLALMAALTLAVQSAGLNEAVAVAIDIALGFLIGLEAATLRSWSLQRAGFAEVGVIEASSQENAELKYFHAVAPPDTVADIRAPLRPQTASQSDPLGLFGNV